MKYWAFHCNPASWNSKSELSEFSDGTWLINKQDEENIKSGDPFILWISGKDAGVYAFGEVVKEPEIRPDDVERVKKFSTDKGKFSEQALRVQLKYSDKIIETPILRSVILNSYWLDKNSLMYSFFNSPQGISSRELTPEVFNHLLELRSQVSLIHEFRGFLYSSHKNMSTSEDYLKMVPKIEGWFIQNNICDKNFSFWNSKSQIHSINQKLNGEFSEIWRKLNKEESNWYSSHWNKWVEFNSQSPIKFWLYAPGEKARKWDELYSSGQIAIGWDDLGNLSQYTTKVDVENALLDGEEPGKRKYNDALACFEFASILKPGDIVIAKKGKREYVGWGVVSGDYFFDDRQMEYKNRRTIDWKAKGEWTDSAGDIVTKTLTDITKYPDYVERLSKLLKIELGEIDTKNIPMENPLNTILYGPPGTGKTYHTVLKSAEIIEQRKINSYTEALAIFKSKLHDQIEFITFHQNYSYEDFIQGLRPDTENDNQLTFDKKDGIFKVIADKALQNLEDSERPPIAKRIFEEVFNEFINPLVEGEEIEVKMKKVSYFITAITNKSIDFRKASGGTAQTLSIGTLKKMYTAESVLDIQGLASYYSPLLESLLKIGKDSSGKKAEIIRKNYVLIIDEINRANISRVFGELITLIEPDKRSHGAIPMEAKLPSGDPFVVPSNLFIIGTMNTADKSIALLDIALRRRFEFEAMYPKYEIEGQEIYDVDILKKINEQIIKSKGHDFQIGHAYFMGENKDLIARMNKKVIPLLLEYYMNDEKEVKGILQSSGLVIEENSWPLRITGTND
ncbi:MAG: EVE domain-containing protein [Chitinophagia bacterium]|nr:EVE domain-containing protein [Chitinophagia bacterium]